MAVTLRRLGGTYTAALVPPVVVFAGTIPETIKTLYQAFTQRYPGIPPDAFRAINTNVLAELGVNIVLLDNRLEIVVRVDQIILRANNIRSEEEVKFLADCILIAHNVVKKLAPEAGIGPSSINISTWLSVDGGRSRVEKALSRVAQPSQSTLLKKNRLGAKRIRYSPRVEIANDRDGWQLTITAELSALPEADLFLLRHYVFATGMKYSDFEQQLAFIQDSTAAISDWLGMEMVGTDGAG